MAVTNGDVAPPPYTTTTPTVTVEKPEIVEKPVTEQPEKMAPTNGTIEKAPADSLFSPSLMSPTVLGALPEGYTMRPLQRTDFDVGFLDVLRVLTHVGDVTKGEFEGRFDQMKENGAGYHILVILDGETKIVGTGALIVERKLYVQ